MGRKKAHFLFLTMATLLAVARGWAPRTTTVLTSPRSRAAMGALPEALSKLTVPALKDLLREQGKPVSGRKADLLARLEGREADPAAAKVARPVAVNAGPPPGARSVLVSACKS